MNTAVEQPVVATAVGLALLRQPFPDHQVNNKPKGTKEQNDCPNSEKRDCKICGGWHHPRIKHLSYVGHAALTDRLLEADQGWSWEPFATKDGLPAFDASGGLWIKLTVCGVTRMGYGNAKKKETSDPGDREKEVIGDALRNAAMRFGAALEFWHKGELHLPPPSDDDPPPGAGAETGKKSLPAYPQDRFDKNLPGWLKTIADGKKTAQDVIETVESSFSLTEEQKSAIKGTPKGDPR